MGLHVFDIKQITSFNRTKSSETYDEYEILQTENIISITGYRLCFPVE